MPDDDDVDMTVLFRRRRNLRARLNRVDLALNGNEQLPAPQVAVHLEIMEELRVDAKQCEDELAAYCDDDELNEVETWFNEFWPRHTELLARLRELAAPPVVVHPVAGGEGNGPNRGQPGQHVKLPKIEIPKFNGDLLEWQSFHDRYVSAIHEQNIPASTKLLYLKDALVGDAGDLLRSTPTTNDAYERAWEAVKKRFKNNREIAKARLDRLTDQPKVMPPYSQSLRKLVDVTCECMRSMEILKLPVDHWDVVIAHIIGRKLDDDSKQQWELKFDDDAFPNLSDLLDFLDRRAKAFGVTEDVKRSSKNPAAASTATHVVVPDQCVCCGEQHQLLQCSKFLAMSVADRHEVARTHRACYNCLRQGHRSQDCSSRGCTICNRKHHALLHFAGSGISGAKQAAANVVERSIRNTLLATAIILVRDGCGEYQEVRAPLDSGSQLTLMTEDCLQRLKLKRDKIDFSVHGVGGEATARVRGRLDATFSSRFDNSFQLVTETLVMKTVTSDQPNFTMNGNLWDHVKNLELADPMFYRSSRIDVLIGGNVLGEILEERLIKGPPGSPIAQKTAFGWVLFGTIRAQSSSINVVALNACCNLDATVQRFFDTDDLPSSPDGNEEDEKAEAHFRAIHWRDATGRYVVRIPFKQDPNLLGNSRQRALRTLLSSERRLLSRPGMFDKYNAVLQEYVDMGHMDVVPPNELISDSPKFYLPHHGVFKESSTTTKLRVVFNASAKTTTGLSLNDVLMVGPRIQDDLFSILVRMRRHPIMLSGDIEKMYRMIQVDSRDRDLQRILWRSSVTDNIKEYRLNTVTFGEASAPFQAVRALHQVAYDEQNNFPLASEVVLRDFYVDDLICSVKSINEAKVLQKQLIEMLAKGGFSLRKWSSNTPELLESLPVDMRETELPLSIDSTTKIKTLGIQWHPGCDQFCFAVNVPRVEEVSKRSILSGVAKVFDPLGWISPLTVRAKMLFQSLWEMKLDWDTEVPTHAVLVWNAYLKDLDSLSDLKIDRFAMLPNATNIELIGFCDSSERAIAAVVFVKSMDQQENKKIVLLAAKTKLAPIKRQTIPKLELNAAVLLAKLMAAVKRALQLDLNNVRAYTDSSIVLTWVTTPPSRWKSYVSRRVQRVQAVLPPECWGHVPGPENPADCATRGLSVIAFLTHSLWWHGPAWLNSGEAMPNEIESDPLALLEEKKIVMAVTEDSVWGHFSSFYTMVRITALCFRFAGNCRRTKEDRTIGFLTTDELRQAEIRLIQLVQLRSFSAEYNVLHAAKELPNKHPLQKLSPFLDQDGVIRVGGRLTNAALSRDRKHPILLPKRHPFTSLLVRYEHIRNLHAGNESLLALVGRRYWIFGARDIIRKHGRSCVRCQRFNASAAQQFMGNLPAVRVSSSDVFSHVGLDYTGPVLLRNLMGKSKLRFKGYIALFICMSTRAMHLELVSDLSTQKCLEAIRRFVGRRGIPHTIYSDCGRNFLGAGRKLRGLYDLLKSSEYNDALTKSLADDSIHWEYNIPYAPSRVGYWEAGIKSVKHHLLRVTGNNVFNYEEMGTLLAQVESCLNSRPLTAVSADPHDLSSLTPGRFLIGRPMRALPDGAFLDKRLGHTRRWQLLQRLLRQFWTRWSREYLTRLQQRPKWLQLKKNLEVGQLVLIKEDMLPPLKWKMARIAEVHPGDDGLVRIVTLRTTDGLTKRSITKISPLPYDDKDV